MTRTIYAENDRIALAEYLDADYCFDVLGISELYAGCYEGNVRSRKMLAACGFVPHADGNCNEIHYLTGEPIIQYDYARSKM